MENDILDSLNDLGYKGPLNDEVAFAKALDGGPKSLEFTKLIHILAEELKKLCHLEESVSMMNNPDESSSFLLELSSFLKELGCPYKCLVTGHMSSRLKSKEDRLLLLDYMISELMAARMVRIECPKDKQASGMEIVVQESPTAKNLKDILIALKFNKPPPNITAEMLFSKLEAKLKDTLQKEGDKLVGKPLYNKAISEKDWKNLETNYSEMYEEYRLRRETLITRLECTIQSFEWSDRLKTKKDVIQSVYRPTRDAMKVKPNVKLSDFLAARTSLLLVEKTSSASVRKNTQSEVNKVIIGQRKKTDKGKKNREQQSLRYERENKLNDGLNINDTLESCPLTQSHLTIDSYIRNKQYDVQQIEKTNELVISKLLKEHNKQLKALHKDKNRIQHKVPSMILLNRPQMQLEQGNTEQRHMHVQNSKAGPSDLHTKKCREHRKLSKNQLNELTAPKPTQKQPKTKPEECHKEPNVSNTQPKKVVMNPEDSTVLSEQSLAQPKESVTQNDPKIQAKEPLILSNRLGPPMHLQMTEEKQNFEPVEVSEEKDILRKKHIEMRDLIFKQHLKGIIHLPGKQPRSLKMAYYENNCYEKFNIPKPIEEHQASESSNTVINKSEPYSENSLTVTAEVSETNDLAKQYLKTCNTKQNTQNPRQKSKKIRDQQEATTSEIPASKTPKDDPSYDALAIVVSDINKEPFDLYKYTLVRIMIEIALNRFIRNPHKPADIKIPTFTKYPNLRHGGLTLYPQDVLCVKKM